MGCAVLYSQGNRTQRYGDFLKSEAVENCIDKARKLVSEVFDYSKALGSLTKSFEAFSKWITIGKKENWLMRAS